MGLMQAYHFFQSYYSQEENLKRQVSVMQTQLEKESLRVNLAQVQLEEFKQDVAVLMPNVIKKEPHNYSMRKLASVVSSPDEIQGIMTAKKAMQLAKDKFQLHDYSGSYKILKWIMEYHSESLQFVEASFLAVESLYMLKRDEECLDLVEMMLSMYPEDQLTGFAMLRMGRIMERNDKAEDAEVIYKLVLKNYKNEKLLKEAKVLIRSLEF